MTNKVLEGKLDLLEAAKRALATMPSDCYDLGYQEARQDLAKAIKQAEKELSRACPPSVNTDGVDSGKKVKPKDKKK